MLNLVEWNCGKCPEKSIDCFNWDQDIEKVPPDPVKKYFHCFVQYKSILDEIKESSTIKICSSGIKTCYLSIDHNKDNNDPKNYEGGCGKCPENKLCITCNEKGCNNDLNKIINGLYCYEQKKRKNICTKKECFISVDFNKDGKDITYQGCGECPNKRIPCKTCNTQLCNHKNVFKNLFFCYDKDGNWKECNNGEQGCYYAKGEDNKVYRGCGKKPEENVQYVFCDQNLCNTKELFDKTLFCLEKKPSETQTRKMIEKCTQKCGVQRLTTGELLQGCFDCKSNTSTKKCKACKQKNYCNKEELVNNNCFDNNGTLCFKGFYEYCFTETIESNKVNRGCGDCPSKKCEICSGHLCNVEDKEKYYCFVSENKNIKGCKEKNYCYVAITEKTVRDKKIEKYDCGTCPTGFLDLFENNKLINMNNVQCAECNNGQLCNKESLFDSQLFCWESDVNKWTANKGKRVCKKGVCFIGVNKQEPVQGCGNCKEYNNLTKCNECSSPLCNNETILPKPIMCYYLNAYFQPFKVKNKECPHYIDNCYISLDIFMRVEQNCGKCPPNYKNCKTCKTNFCNNSTLLSIPTTKTNIILTSTKTTTTMKKSLTTKFNFNIKSNSNNNNKFKIEILIMLNILAIIFNIL